MNTERLKKLIQSPRYTRKLVALDGGRALSYSECGNIESGVPVLFCFGLMTSSVAIMFAHDVAIQNNFRMIAVDYPGIGESTPMKNRKLHHWANDMNEFCDTVLGKSSTVRLLGHSLGGLHTLALLSDRKFKSRVIRTVLLAPWVHFDGDSDVNPQWLTLARKLPQVFQISIIPTVISQLSSSFVSIAGWSNPNEMQVQLASMVTEYGRFQGNAGNEQMVRIAISEDPVPIPSNLRTPVIIYHGTNDHLVNEKAVRTLVGSMNGRGCASTMISVDDGDHNGILAETTCFAKVMSSLLGDEPRWEKDVIGSIRGLREKARPRPDVHHEVSATEEYQGRVHKGRSVPARTTGHHAPRTFMV